MNLRAISLPKIASYLLGTALVLAPFHAFLSVWGSGTFGHYTELRLWDALLLLALSVIGIYWLVTDKPLRSWLGESLLIRLMLAYIGLTLILGVVSLAKQEVSAKALLYGLLVNIRPFVWFTVGLLVAKKTNLLSNTWARVLIIPALVVIAFAILQYLFLPHDFLKHFNYNAATNIAPIETINHNPNYIRVQSTLRGANPLGAYLVVTLSAVGVLLWSARKRVLSAAIGVAGLFALYASGSRSAWIGAVLSVAIIVWVSVRTRRGRAILSAAALGVAVILTGVFLLLQNNAAFQNAVLHTEDNSQVAVSSNDAHLSAIQESFDDVVAQPLGDGPGTAGPASVYNTEQPARIADNYYLQIAQETGWLGLALFLCIIALVGWELYLRAKNSRLALALCASLAGIVFINLLSHAWVDPTLACVWWSLAGIALAAPITKPKSTQ